MDWEPENEKEGHCLRSEVPQSKMSGRREVAAGVVRAESERAQGLALQGERPGAEAGPPPGAM